MENNLKVELLLSTMNFECKQEFAFKNKNIKDNCLIINQTNNSNINIPESKIIILENNIRILHSETLGISKSRNLAIKNAIGKYCLFTDDDTILNPLYEEIIIDSFEKNPNADILIFKADSFNNLPLRKHYPLKEKSLNKKDVLHVSSIEICIKKKSIIDQNLNFNELFGLGSTFTSGEEAIFLTDALSKKLNIVFIPKTIVYHPPISSGYKFDNNLFTSKGALFYKLFGFYSIVILPFFIFKKKIEYTHKVCFLKALHFGFVGIYKYLKINGFSFNNNASL